jgi:hypothetical protein
MRSRGGFKINLFCQLNGFSVALFLFRREPVGRVILFYRRGAAAEQGRIELRGTDTSTRRTECRCRWRQSDRWEKVGFDADRWRRYRSDSLTC